MCPPQTLSEIHKINHDKVKFLDLNLRVLPEKRYKTPIQVLKDHLVFHQAEGHTREIREYEAAIEVLSIAFD
jgi:hypothetical protein